MAGTAIWLLVTLPLVSCPSTAAGGVLTAETSSNVPRTRLLIANRNSLQLHDAASGKSRLLRSQRASKVQYDPRTHHVLFFAHNEEDGLQLVHTDLRGTQKFQSDPPFFPKAVCTRWISKQQLQIAEGYVSVSLDWISGNLYISSTCGAIRVCNIASLRCSIIGRVEAQLLGTQQEIAPYLYATPLVLHLEKRLVFWIEHTAIVRASMDGLSIRTIMKVETPPGSVQVIKQMATDASKIYWTVANRKGIERCNFDGLQHERLSVQTAIHSFVLGVHKDWIYWLEREQGELQRVILMLEDHKLAEVANPCERNNCSYLCAQSERPAKFSCLCDQGFSIHPDGTTCVGDLIILATSSGILQIPLHDGNASELASEVGKLSDKVPNPIVAIASDAMRGQILWAEYNREGLGIYKRDVLHAHDSKKQIIWQHGSWPIFGSEPELQTMSIDWITGSVYTAFRNHRRFYACDQDTTLCAELLGNQVSGEVRSLVLHPTQGIMFWIQREGPRTWSVMKAPMDRANGPMTLITKSEGQELRGVTVDYTGDRVFWADADFSEIHWSSIYGGNTYGLVVLRKNFIPQRLRVYKGTLYFSGGRHAAAGTGEAIYKVGITDSTYENEHGVMVREELLGNFTYVHDFDVYHSEMKERAPREGQDGSNGCSGSRLRLRGPTGFTCACAKGFSRSTDGNCSALEFQDFMYHKQPITLVFRHSNGTEYPMFTTASTVWSMAYDHGRNEMFWTGVLEQSHSNSRNGTTSGCMDINKVTFRSTVKPQESSLWQHVPITAKVRKVRDSSYKIVWMEYDWLGDNIYFARLLGSLGLCTRARANCCTEIRNRTGPTGIRIGSRLALDPHRGRIYWATQAYVLDGYQRRVIYASEMDGSGLKVFMRDVYAHALAVDQDSGCLYWAQEPRASSSNIGSEAGSGLLEIMSIDLNGQNVQSIMVTSNRHFLGLTIAGNWLYWWIEIEPNAPPDTRKEFLFLLRPHPAKPKNPCSGRLCSHICVPSSSSYMRCLCPLGSTLMPNGWNCECTNTSLCNSTDERNTHPRNVQVRTNATAQAIAALQRNCESSGGDDDLGEYPCHTTGTCVLLNLICNGNPDCADYSDEGPLCNELCPPDLNCSFKCSPSPAGPICVCPPGKILDEDMKTCIKADLRLTMAFLLSATLFIALVIVSVLAACKYRITKRGKRKMTLEEVEEFLQGDPSGVEIAATGIDRAIRLPFKHILPPESIIIARDTVLGSGEFGTVHPGFLNGEAVAIKTLKSTVDIEEFKGILAEIKIMAYIGHHQHVVKYVGADVSRIQERKVLVLTELSPYGDLLKYLQKVASVGLGVQPATYENIFDPQPTVTALTLIHWCGQIAAGMEHLSAKQIVHGDLATRNVLVFKQNIVKIADFGLSKQLEGNALYILKRQAKLPWKWCSIELLKHMKLSEASDVWAFGVTAWEIFSLGQSPYNGKRFSKEFVDFLQAGNRLPAPVHASEEAYKVLLACWNEAVHLRPNFSTLRQFFQEQPQASLQKRRLGNVDDYVSCGSLTLQD